MSSKKEKRSIEATLTDSDEEADTAPKQKDSSSRQAKNEPLYSSSSLYSKFSNLGDTIHKKVKNELDDFDLMKHKFDAIENETEVLNNNKKLKTEPARTSFADKMMVKNFFC